MLHDKTDKMLAIEGRLGCSIEQYVERMTEAGFSIPQITLQIQTETKVPLTSACLRLWIKKAGGRLRIEFPDQEPVTA